MVAFQKPTQHTIVLYIITLCKYMTREFQFHSFDFLILINNDDLSVVRRMVSVTLEWGVFWSKRWHGNVRKRSAYTLLRWSEDSGWRANFKYHFVGLFSRVEEIRRRLFFGHPLKCRCAVTRRIMMMIITAGAATLHTVHITQWDRIDILCVGTNAA